MGKHIDRILRFDGFGGTESACHIRILPKKNGHGFIIVCTQLTEYYGTSITNGFELIVAKIYSKISCGAVDMPSIPTTTQKTSSIFDKIKKFIQPNKEVNPIRELFSKSIWIERYPAGTVRCSPKTVPLGI